MKKPIICIILGILLCAGWGLVKAESVITSASSSGEIKAELDKVIQRKDSSVKGKLLLGFLTPSYPAINNTAARAFYVLPKRYKIRPTINALRAKVPQLREYASRTLGVLGNKKAVTPLLQAIFNDPYTKVRRNALASLLKLTTQNDLILRLGDTFNVKGCGPYHIRAVSALGKIGQYNDTIMHYLVSRLKGIIASPSDLEAQIHFGDVFTYLKDFKVVGVDDSNAADLIKDTIYDDISIDLKRAKGEEFIKIEQELICQVLTNITDKDFGKDAACWVEWWSTEKNKPLSQRYNERREAIVQVEIDQGQGYVNVAGHLQLAFWCRVQDLEQDAVREFATVLNGDPDNTSALTQLKDMGYVKHQNQWQPLKKVLPVQEKLVTKLIRQTKSSNDQKREDALAQLEGIESLYKLRPFIKTLKTDPLAETRIYAVKSLVQMKDPRVTPYLVMASLVDKSEGVRTAALNVVKQPSNISWYIHCLERKPTGAMVVRGAQILADIGTGDPRSVTALVRRLYFVTMEIRVQMAMLDPQPPRLRFLDLDLNTQVPPRVQLELPDMSSVSIKSNIVAPVEGPSSEVQLNALGDALSQLTGQNFGLDYQQWRSWWKKQQAKK